MHNKSNKDSTKEDVTERYDLTGRKLAFIFSWNNQSDLSANPNQRDINAVGGMLKDLGFVFNENMFMLENDFSDESSDSDSDSDSDLDKKESNVLSFTNMGSLELIRLMSWIASRVTDASCIVMYFITCQSKNAFMEEYERHVPVLSVWRKFKKINCPKLFFIQANITDQGAVQSCLLNAEGHRRKASIPDSANVLLAYLPNFGDAAKSVVDILKEELHKPYDINTILTTIIDRINSKDRKPNAKFSSTLLKLLYLTDRQCNPSEDQLPLYRISEGKKCLAFAFLFGKFEMCSPLMTLVNFDIMQLTSAFNILGFNLNFCVKDGQMTVKEFHEKLKEILQDKEKMEMCECIMILISSHGEEDGVIYASNGLISRDIVVTALSECKELEGKPKLVFIDACRGSQYGSPLEYNVSSPSSNTKEHSSATMYSARRYHAVYDDDIWRLTGYEKPEMSDVMLVMSSTEGTVSVFRSDQGSHFLKTFCEKLTKYGKDYNFMTVLISTMCTVAHLDILYQGMVLKQQITFTSSLRKLLRFPK